MAPGTPPHRPWTGRQKALAWLPLLVWLAVWALSLHQPLRGDEPSMGTRFAWWLVDHGYPTAWAPSAIHHGHPQTWAWYWVGVWQLLGASLPAMHLAQLPWLLLAWVQLRRLALASLPGWAGVLALALAALDPTLMAQAGSLSWEPATLALALAGAAALQRGHMAQAALWLMVLPLISLRAWTAVFALGLGWAMWQLLRQGWPITRAAWRPWRGAVLAFGPALLVAVAWAWLHQRHYGWVVANPDPEWPWAGHRDPVSAAGMLRNLAIYTWRLLDHGRGLLYLAAGLAVVGLWRRQGRPRLRGLVPAMGLPLWVVVAFVAVHGVAFVPVGNPMGHRYFVLVYALAPLALMGLLAAAWPKRPVRWVALGVGVVLLSSHAWVYPLGLKQDEHATLLGHPHGKLRRVSVAWFARQGVTPGQVAAPFSLYGPFRDLDPGTAQPLGWLDAKHHPTAPYRLVTHPRQAAKLPALGYSPADTLAAGRLKWVIWRRAQAP